MKKISLGLIASIMLLTVISFAQTVPQPPASWVAFQKEEGVKRAAFNKEMNADREQFFRFHPEVKAYFAEAKAANQARMAQWRAQHPK